MSDTGRQKLQRLEARSLVLQNSLFSTLDVLNRRRSEIQSRVQTARKVAVIIGLGALTLFASKLLLSSDRLLLSSGKRMTEPRPQFRPGIGAVVALFALGIGAFFARRIAPIDSVEAARSHRNARRQSAKLERVMN